MLSRENDDLREMLAEMPWGDLPYDRKTIAEIVHDYSVTRGDLCEQYARDQLTAVIGRHVAQARAEGAAEVRARVEAVLADRAAFLASEGEDERRDEVGAVSAEVRAALADPCEPAC